MKAKFNLINTDSLEAEMTIKMTFYEWKKVQKTLVDGPTCSDWQLGYRIRDMVTAAEQVFDAKDTVTETDRDQEAE